MELQLNNALNKGTLLTETHKALPKRIFTNAEVKEAMWDIDGGKAPRSDGFRSAFFKGAWEDVGEDISTTALDFLITRKLLKEINGNSIILIPKNKFPESVQEFKPFSCYNVLYKFISKVIGSEMSS